MFAGDAQLKRSDFHAKLFWREATFWVSAVEAVLGILIVISGVGRIDLGVGVLALSLAAVGVWLAERLGKFWFGANLAFASLLASYADYQGGPALILAVVLGFVWITLIAFAFLPRTVGAIYVVLIAITYAIALVMRPDIADRTEQWVLIVVSLAVVGLFTSRLVRRLARLAYVDELTGLPNRRYLLATMRREMMRASRTGSPLSIALADLDEFKRINDTQGHLAGDRLLIALGERWTAGLRATDFLGRYGGDEFVVVFPGCTTREASRVMTRVIEGNIDLASASFGVAEWNMQESYADLLSRCDRELYASKIKRKQHDKTDKTGPTAPVELRVSRVVPVVPMAEPR